MKSSLSLMAITGLCVLLAGCADPAQVEAMRREQEQRDHNTCVGYGTVPNTPAYNDCRQDLAMSRSRDYDYGYAPPYPPAYPTYHRYGDYYPYR